MALVELTDKEQEALRLWRAREAQDVTPEQRAALIEAARDRHAYGSDNEVEVDDDAQISLGEDGAFVQGWLWVPNEEDEEEVEDEDDNPFHPESPEGRAWDRGDRSFIKEEKHD